MFLPLDCFAPIYDNEEGLRRVLEQLPEGVTAKLCSVVPHSTTFCKWQMEQPLLEVRPRELITAAAETGSAAETSRAASIVAKDGRELSRPGRRSLIQSKFDVPVPLTLSCMWSIHDKMGKPNNISTAT